LPSQLGFGPDLETFSNGCADAATDGACVVVVLLLLLYL
jgi:hypothetical protein